MCIRDRFSIIQEETEQNKENFVSALTIDIPLPFSEEFFKWFEFRAWERVKSIIKEMKRRRGKGNAIIVEILFTGKPNVRFVTDLNENHVFNSAIEKIDFVVELLPYHLNDSNIPSDPSEVLYKYGKTKKLTEALEFLDTKYKELHSMVEPLEKDIK